jgi:hypothetical protein
VARLCALACLPLLFIAGVFFAWPPRSGVRQAPVAKGQGAGVSVATLNVPPLKFITDEQLLALFPGRPLALIGKPGQQQLLFLGQPAPSSPEASTTDP